MCVYKSPSPPDNATVHSMAPPAGRLTDDGLPLAVGLRDLVGAAHLAERHAADDEHHDAWPGAVLPGGLVLVPVTVPGTAG